MHTHGRSMPTMKLTSILLGMVCLFHGVFSSAAHADEESVSSRIDRFIAEKSPDYAQQVAPLSSDAEFLRRITLDLTGTIPTPEVTRAFLADADPEKRNKVIDRLLDSPEYSRQMQRVFDLLMMQRRPAKNIAAAQWQTYLRESFAANKPWNQMVNEILDSDGLDPAMRPAARFFLDRDGEVNEITRDIGTVFLGVNLECAQCHNHPHVEDWKQRHYYGIAAFLIRSFPFKDKAGMVLAEKAEGEVTFESVFDVRDKISPGPQTSFPRLFDGERILEPKFDIGQGYAVAPEKDVRPVPLYSRRAMLGETITNNGQFPRTLANRLWAIMLGRGIVHPLNYDHSENPPSHPELLDFLTETVVARNYDIKSILRDIARTRTYQLSSRAQDPTAEMPDEEAFAQALLKPLMPEQFAQAMLEATGVTTIQRNSLGAKLTEDALFGRLAGLENQFINLFQGEAGKPHEEFDVRIDQTLYLSNDPVVQGWLKPASGNLVDRLQKFAPEETQALAEELYLSTFTRLPSEEETADVASYLAASSSDRVQAIQELVWAMVTSAEFRFNH